MSKCSITRSPNYMHMNIVGAKPSDMQQLDLSASGAPTISSE